MEPEIAQFTELIKKAIKEREYLKWVAFALKLIHKFDHEYALEAKDIVNEVIMKVMTGERCWNKNVDLDRFMYRNIQSYFFNYLRKQKRFVYEYESRSGEKNSNLLIESMNNKSADYIIDRYDLDNLTDLCLKKLNDMEKEVFTELNKGLTPIEIAKKLRIGRFNVYYMRRRIQKKIGGLLK